ncbi:MAG TPA: glycoside hydrolase family 31 protein [Motilibacterales bacterium]|nr:glycoside hydrolase family 31 protein [Motilibacterales bacterium]
MWEGLRGTIHGATTIGPANSLRAVGYALARDLADRSLEPRPTTPHRTPGDARGAAIEDGGVRIRFPTTFVDLRFLRYGQVSVGWQGALDEPSWALVPGADPAAPDLEQAHGGWIARGPGIAVHVDHSGAMTYLDEDGRTRRHDDAPTWDGVGWSLRTALAEGATLHGLGGRTAWDLRGAIYRCWNTDPGGAWLPGRDPLYVTTPVYAVLDDLGATHCFIDNPCDATIDATGTELVARFDAGPLRLHVSLGSLPEVLDAYTALTGRPSPPPRWALGHHQARWGYGSSEVVREVWQGFAENDLPLSAMHLDIDHMERYRNFTFGTEHWAGIGDLIAEMRADGVRTVVIVDAGMARDGDYGLFREARDRDLFCRSADGSTFEGVVWPGPTAFPDFTSPHARHWWGEQFSFYADLGIAGYWHDMNEPACFAAWGDPTFPLSTRHELEGRPSDHRDAHNIYGLLMCRASYEGLRHLRPDERPFLFSRSGWAGMQRYGGHWSGDIEASWPSLRATLHQAFGYGISGVGYYGSDIGGFTGRPTPELFTRWFQLASFLPFFRTHCAWHVPRREPWEWGPEVMDRLRSALRRRYRLMPLWYTLALESSGTGAPYVRPLAWSDPTLRGMDDVFLLGDDVLVAPVLEEAGTVRTVSLPDGVWFHGDTGQCVEGTVEVPVGPDDIPWFVRAGAVIPTQEDGRLVLLVAPPVADRPSPGGRLLTDSGDGWDAPHDERYASTLVEGAVVVTREVVHQGDFGFRSVEVRALDGRPARLA